MIQILRLCNKFLEFVENFAADCHINCGLILVIVGKQIWVSCKQELKTESVTVLRAKMTRRVAVYVLRIDVSTVLDEGLDHAEISSETSDVQRRTEIVRSRINLSPIFD